MKLNKIYGYIGEGIFIHDYSGLSPTTLHRAKGGKSDKPDEQDEKAEKVSAIYMGRGYHYRERDQPSDLVKLEPLLTSTTLNIAPADPQARSSFKGAKIYYGFKIDDNTQDEFTSQLETGGDLWTDIEEIVQSPYIGDKRGQVVQVYDEDTPEDLTKTARVVDKAAISSQSDPEQAAELEKLADTFRRAVGAMREHGIGTVAELQATAKGPQKQRDLGQQHLRHSAMSLAKKIKNPTPGTPEEEMSRQVLEKAAAYWVRMKPEGYDIITYPASKSNFNSKFIAQLKQAPAYSAVPVVELQKLYYHETTIDVDSVYKFMKKKQQEVIRGKSQAKAISQDARDKANIDSFNAYLNAGYDLDTDVRGQLKPDDPRWVEWRTALTCGTLENALKVMGKSGGKLDVKAMVSQQVRATKRYLDMFSAQGLDATGKRVLVVDDNVAYSATMQILNHMIKKQNPALIDLYTPFYMGN